MPGGRPKGSYTAGSLRDRVRCLLSDGRPRSTDAIARELREDVARVRTAVHSARTEGELKSEHVYSLRAGEIDMDVVRAAGKRDWFDV